MNTYAIYYNPTDYPGFYVCRRWASSAAGIVPDPEPLMMCQDIERIRELLGYMGLVRLMPAEGDDPVIVETWL
jgi:hypothetical protein